MWFFLSLACAGFFAAQGAAAKRVAPQIHPDMVTWAAFLLSIPVYIVVLLVRGVPSAGPDFWMWLGLSLACNLVAMPMFFRSLSAGELSLVLPLSTLTPVFTLGTGYLLRGEIPGAAGVAGICTIVGGAYLLSFTAGEQRNPLAAFVALSRNRGARLMIGAALLWSVSAVADRAAVQASSPTLYVTAFAAAFSLAFLPWLLAQRHPVATHLRRDLRPLLLVAAFGAGMALTQMAAMDLALAAMVVAIKRFASLFGVLLGGWLFQERGLGMRLLATALMVAGGLLLATG